MTALGSIFYDDLPNGAGGYVKSLAFANDGTLLCTCDTCNGYILEDDATSVTGKRWRPLLRRTNIPAAVQLAPDEGFAPNADGPGMWFAAPAPSNSNRIYGAFIGRLLRSDDKADNWSLPNASATFKGYANGSSRLFNPLVAIDPANDDVLLWSSSDAKLYYSDDAGVTQTEITARVPAPTTGNAYLVAYDATSTVTGGKTQRIIVASDGNGVYESANGGTSFSLLAGGPTTPFNFMLVDAFGRIWIPLDNTSGGANNVFVYESGSWLGMAPAGTSGPIRQGGVAVDPTNANYVTTMGKWNGTGLTKCEDFATARTWNDWYVTNGGMIAVAEDIPWMDGKLGSYGMHAFDPTGTTIYVCTGLGVSRVNKAAIPATRAAGSMTFSSVALGIEQLVVRDVSCGISGRPVTAQSDRSFMGFTDSFSPPLAFGPSQNLNHGSGVSASMIDPSYVTGQAENGNGTDAGTCVSGVSINGGLDWSRIPGGAIWGDQVGGGTTVCSAQGQILHMAGGRQPPWITFDNGDNWDILDIPNVPKVTVTSPADLGWSFQNAVTGHRRAATEDGATPGVFYVMNYGAKDSSGVDIPNTAGFYRCAQGVNSWTRISNTGPNILGWQARLYGVPGKGGHLFYCVGDVPTKALKFASNGLTAGANELVLTDIPAMTQTWDVAFGRAAPGAIYHAIYAIGYDAAGTTFGVWRCIDFDPTNPAASTWTFLVDYPLGHLTAPIAIAADPDEYGRFYMAMGKGSGSMQARTRARFAAV